MTTRSARRSIDLARAPRRVGLALVCLAALAGPAAAEVRLLVFGDSLTQGYRLPEAEGFIPQLDAWLTANGAEDVELINGGVSGDTSAGGLARIGWSLTEDVDAVIVELGANDMLRGLDPALVRENLDGILDAIAARGLPAMLCGIPAPPNFGEDYRVAFEAVFRDLAAEHAAVPCPSFLAGISEGRSLREAMALMQPDGIHPNAEGVRAMVAAIGPSVLTLAAKARAAP